MVIKHIHSYAVRIFSPLFCGAVYFALWVVVLDVSQRFLHSIGVPDSQDAPTPGTLQAALVSSLVVIGSSTLLAVIWTRLHRQSLKSVGLDDQVCTLWPGLGFAALGIAITFALSCMNGSLLVTGIRSISSAFSGMWLLFLRALGAGINEEIVFRGIFYSISERHWPQWVTAIVSSAGFALLHVYSDPVHHLGRLMVTFMGGLLFAWARCIHGSLWLPIGLHIGFDFTEWLLNLMGDEPRSPFFVSPSGPPCVVGEAGLTSWLPLLIAGGSLLLYSRLRKPDAHEA